MLGSCLARAELCGYVYLRRYEKRSRLEVLRSGPNGSTDAFNGIPDLNSCIESALVTHPLEIDPVRPRLVEQTIAPVDLLAVTEGDDRSHGNRLTGCPSGEAPLKRRRGGPAQIDPIPTFLILHESTRRNRERNRFSVCDHSSRSVTLYESHVKRLVALSPPQIDGIPTLRFVTEHALDRQVEQ